ncbi:fibronectin type III domain-containing protein [Geobacter sp. AOG1]|uniref:fibronectin type III domain-containing protein n=1 Tax=Geobacter sp. AOG1 TaxID=1566346 RepID=UPI001CC4C584|nr:DUF5666 domain-containing protein [Geobacter sp. AOG1]GFE58581.1 hypothetical protein AOG1_24610 [Geobacter sp. AOG1]
MKKCVLLYQLFVAVLAISVMAMAGCGGGGGGGTAPAASTQVVSKGAITKLGSIFVNGVEYDTTGTTVTMENPDDSAGGLKVGMVVTVKGTLSDSTHAKATSVTFADNLTGPIASFDGTAGTMTVLGQTVKFDSSTVFDNFPTQGTSSVLPGQMVQVSGFTNADGSIQATRIERHTPDWTQTTTVELKGTIGTMNGAVFTIGGMTVDATGLTLPAGTVAGSFVKAEGKLLAFSSTTLKATSVSSYNDGIETEGGTRNHMDVEGYVRNLSGTTFMVGGTLVNAGTLSLAGIANGVKVEVEGVFANGVLIASKITIEGAVVPTTVPAAPVVSAVAGMNQVTVSWNGVSGATSYNIYWSTTAGVTPATGTKIANATSPYVQTGLTAGTTYYYVVTAVNSVGESAPSAQVSAIPTSAPTVPAAPIGVSAVGGANQVTVSWAAVAGATSYNIYWSTTSGVTPATGTKITGAASPYVQTGLTAATAYYYVVTAVNAAGESAPSAQVSATTASAAVLPAPTGVTAVGGTGQVTITWSPVTGATSYNIYWSTTTGVTPLTGTLIANATSPYMQTGRTASTTYYYVVTAVNAAGESAPSAQASATTAAAPQPPAAPTGVTAVGGTNQVTVSWAVVTGATSYNIYWSTTSGVTPATGTKITGVTSPYIQTGLAASTTYYYVVTAVNAVGESAPSAQVSATTAAPALDGLTLYNTNCSGCHGPPSALPGRTAAQIQAAINSNIGGMGFLSFLTPAQIQAIASIL